MHVNTDQTRRGRRTTPLRRPPSPATAPSGWASASSTSWPRSAAPQFAVIVARIPKKSFCNMPTMCAAAPPNQELQAQEATCVAPACKPAAGAAQAGIWQGDFNGHAPKPYSFEKAEQMMLSLFGILTFIFFVQTMRMNRALQARPRPQRCSLHMSATSGSGHHPPAHAPPLIAL